MDNHRFYALEISNIDTKMMEALKIKHVFPFSNIYIFPHIVGILSNVKFQSVEKTTRLFHWPFVLETPKFPNRPQL